MSSLGVLGRAQTTPSRTALIVLAKAPVPGTVKTRLCPPLTPAEAAILAAAALLDTMDAVENCVGRVSVAPVLALSGNLCSAARGADIASRVEQLEAAETTWQLVGQRGRTFAERLHHAHIDGGARRATLQVGMDTPQVSAELLADAVRTLWRSGTDAVLGPCIDGGWWALGLRPGVSGAFLADIPMSTAETYARTLAAMRRDGLRVAILPTLTDVDTVADGQVVAAQAPATRFAVALKSMLPNRLDRSGPR